MQSWGDISVTRAGGGTVATFSIYGASRCSHCSEWVLWKNARILDPEASVAPICHPDTPADVRRDYDEASSVLGVSPRSAAALLRLAVQKLCKVLGGDGENINDDVAKLVKKGLPDQVQKSLDIVRVIGNEQVHPGQLDVRDNPEIAIQLFELINFITEDQISRPARIQELYERLPASKLEAIDKRDGRQVASSTVNPGNGNA